MSLILDALRKLDREKRSQVNGIVVIGSAPLPGWLRVGAPMLLLLVLAFSTGLFAALLWLRSPAAAEVEDAAASDAASPEATAGQPAPPAAPVAEPGRAAAADPAQAAAPGQGTPAGRTPALAPGPPPQQLPTTGAAPWRLASPPPAAAGSASALGPRGTRPAGAPGAAAFTLQAISERDGRPVTIINDRMLREGDSFDGARVVRIAPDAVELEVAGRRVVLRF